MNRWAVLMQVWGGTTHAQYHEMESQQPGYLKFGFRNTVMDETAVYKTNNSPNACEMTDLIWKIIFDTVHSPMNISYKSGISNRDATDNVHHSSLFPKV
jgi:hypothetical protein